MARAFEWHSKGSRFDSDHLQTIFSILMQISAQNISLAFGDRDLLDDISFTMNEKSRIALVGANGEGKTTLMRVVAGLESADSGIIAKDKNATLLYATQARANLDDIPLKDEVFKVFESFPHEEHEKESIFSLVSKGLGFKREDWNKNCSLFSQGYQMRISLLKVLCASPTFMFLDEPTNYLDIDTRLWLLKYLKSLSGGYMLVSHDRYFLDEAVNEVYEIEKGRLTRYSGGYTDYETKRIKDIEVTIKKAEEQEKQIKKTEAFIERFRYKATKSKAVQSKIKALDKIEIIELPRHLRHVKFTIPYVGYAPNDILTVDGLTKYYTDKCIFKDASFYVRKKDRIGIVGRNGEGKSTLLRLITGSEGDYTGTIKIGENVKLEYFKGDESLFINENVPLSTTVFDYAKNYGDGDEQNVKNMLGAFMFQGDDILKSVSVLSGGERSRLELLTCIMHPSSLLVLDEPTNHLDIASKDVLINAIKNYDGTLIFVSHDVNFIKEIATKIIHIENQAVSYFDGGWDYYTSRMRDMNVEGEDLVFGKINLNKDVKTPESVKEVKAEKLSYEDAKRLRNEKNARERRIKTLDSQIDETTANIKMLEDKLLLKEVYTSFEKSKQVNNEIATLKEALEALEEEWLNLNS